MRNHSGSYKVGTWRTSPQKWRPRVEFSDFRQSPEITLRADLLMEGVATHRWECYVVPEGQTVENIERFGDYKRLRGEVPGDGNVFDHQFHQERLIREYAPLDVGSLDVLSAGYVKIRPIDLRDLFSLRVCALTHDLGEIKHGDTVSDQKHLVKHTVRDEIAATRHFIRRALVGRDPRRARRFERTIMAKYAIDHDKSHRLYGLFKLYEKYSYLNGAIAAYDEGRGAVAHTEWLVHDVLKNQIEPLVKAWGDGVPSTRAFLSERRETISAMFDFVRESGFTDLDPKNEAAFERAWELWADFSPMVEPFVK